MAVSLVNRFKNLKIRWKMLVMILPLVVVPVFLLGALIGYIATDQAYRGLTERSKADLDHMASFTLDLLDGHHRQFEVYREDKQQIVREEMKSLVDLAYNLINEQLRRVKRGETDRLAAQEVVRNSFKQVSIGQSGYLYAITGAGLLSVHPAREGENILASRTSNGRYFIRDLIERAREAAPQDVLYTIYPWSNDPSGAAQPRDKIVAFRYVPEWDWIVAAGDYLDETYADPAFERQALATLAAQIKSKKVGETGYIYCLARDGTLTIHPDSEGENILNARDSEGRAFVAQMVAQKNGWIRYPWQQKGESRARMKIVRYRYFEPWDWIVAVGSYEDEFYQQANALKWRIARQVVLLPLLIGILAAALLFLAAKILTDPLQRMMGIIRQVKGGRLDCQVPVTSRDELGELGLAFNRMIRLLRRNKDLEIALAQQGKMASLGVLSSGVAHEINNPLGVILGYAGYLEKKIPPEDATYTYIHEIKRESKRCKKIVQDLLSYARTPQPDLQPVNINRLLRQIIDFAGNHTDLYHVQVTQDLAVNLPLIAADSDQVRQVAINLLLNAGAATPAGGRIEVASRLDGDAVRIDFRDQGTGIEEEHLDRIFEPFFTTKSRGTGLGLAITKQIIDMHGGEIFIDSRLGQGTTVSLRMPLANEDE